MNKNSIKRNIILAQCAGCLSLLAFSNGFLLSYFARMGISSENILMLLAIPQICSLAFSLPAAFYSDLLGKKKNGTIGQLLMLVGFVLIVIGTFDKEWVLLLSSFGIFLFGVGYALFSSNWFGLLKPIIDEKERGRFFGLLRSSWQSVSILFTFFIVYLFKDAPGIGSYRFVLILLAISILIRFFLYLTIPEIKAVDKNEKKTGSDVVKSSPVMSIRSSLRFVLQIPNYLSYCAYMFLLMFFVSSCPMVLNLLQKDYLDFSENQILWMGNMLALGSVIGFYFGGKFVDKWGTKSVFLFCHFMFSFVLILIIVRGLLPIPSIYWMGALTVLFGICMASSSVAHATEMLSLVPLVNISFSTSLAIALLAGGKALSAILFSQVLSMKVLNVNWKLFGMPMTEYDSLLLFSSIMVLVLVVTLGLIPSVAKGERKFPSA